MPIVIFDMDGVLYRGAQVLPYAREALDRLRRASWDVFFATNNSTATRLDYLGRLQRLGLGGDLDHIVTSGYATAHYLERRRPKPNDVLVIGADGLREEIRAVGIAVRDADSLPGLHPPPEAAADGVDPGAMRRYLVSLDLPPAPDAVVVGLDLHLTYPKIAEAQRAILAGALTVMPFLKYPPNPPGVGDPAILAHRPRVSNPGARRPFGISPGRPGAPPRAAARSWPPRGPRPACGSPRSR